MEMGVDIQETEGYHQTMAKDIFDKQVKNALIKDGWKITQDPLTLRISEAVKLQIDLKETQKRLPLKSKALSETQILALFIPPWDNI